MIKNQHVPIMVNEILSFIDGKKNLSILDCTFGGGGHSKKFLESGPLQNCWLTTVVSQPIPLGSST